MTATLWLGLLTAQPGLASDDGSPVEDRITVESLVPPPGAIPYRHGKLQWLESGEGPHPTANDVVTLMIRTHTRQGPDVTVAHRVWETPLVKLQPHRIWLIRQLKPGGIARVWPDVSHNRLEDIELVWVKPSGRTPDRCDEPNVVERSITGGCLFPVSPRSESVRRTPDTWVILRGGMWGCTSSGRYEEVFSELDIAPDGTVSGRLCLLENKRQDFFPSNCGDGSSADRLITVGELPPRLRLATTGAELTIPQELSSRGHCFARPSPK